MAYRTTFGLNSLIWFYPLKIPKVLPGCVEHEPCHGVGHAAELYLLELDEVGVPGEGEEVQVWRLNTPAIASPVLQ